jgi:hypothetical protein
MGVYLLEMRGPLTETFAQAIALGIALGIWIADHRPDYLPFFVAGLVIDPLGYWWWRDRR